MPEIIEISYVAHGQVGPKPRPVAHGSTFRFVCNDPGTLTIQFLGISPLESGAMTVGANEDFTAANHGSFKFMCVLTNELGNVRKLGDPSDPKSPPGGEIQIPPPHNVKG